MFTRLGDILSAASELLVADARLAWLRVERLGARLVTLVALGVLAAICLCATLAGVAVILALGYLTLEVTTLFHGPVLTSGRTTDAEQYAYSAVWLSFGVALLLAGFVLRSRPARLASAAVVALTIAKVFLVDMSGLTGVYRALSFIGLGLVLVAIGWLYQRILFPQRPAAQ